MSADRSHALHEAPGPLTATGPRPPSVTIVMPVYNGERFLEQALESVAAQTLTDYELLIVDDGSTDRSLAIAEAHASRDPRIRTLRVDHGGVAAARNQALHVARAPLVALWDHDDLCEPERLAVQVAFLDANPDVAVLGAYAWYIGPSGSIHGVLEMEPTTRRAFMAIRDEGGAVFALASSAVFRAHVARSLGGFRPSMETSEDTDLWTRIADDHVVLILPRRLVRYRLHAASASSRRFFVQRELNDLHGANAKRRRAGLPEIEPAEYHRMLRSQPLTRRLQRGRVWRSRYFYRKGGGLLADGRPQGAAYLALAALLAPMTIARRMRPQVTERLRRR